MSGYSEKGTTQQGVIDLLVEAGWRYVPGAQLPRTVHDVAIESELRGALERLNPSLMASESGIESADMEIRRAILATEDDGLMAANEILTHILRGLSSVLLPETNKDEPYRVIDFDQLENNTFIVSDEVSYGGARFDIVLFVNGLPVVVGEAKTPVHKNVSWLNGASDIHTAYEVKQAPFFAPNLLNFAVDGKELRYAGIRTPLDKWNLWGDSTQDASIAGWDRIALTVEQLLSPATVVKLIAHYAMFETDASDGATRVIKLLPRYFQYETVEAIVDRVVNTDRKRGLIYHTQGSGKTLAMSWVATRLLLDPRMKMPTVLAVADRTQLVTQTYNQFAAAGAPEPIKAESTAGLHKALKQQERGIIATTVHKFKGAGLLSERENIIVLVDEAHRTQEGELGQQMRKALPNASWFGFTGTPIADSERNTFKLFGDADDPDWAINTYNSDRSIADGITVPIVVVPRPVKFHINKQALDEEFDEFAEAAELTDAQKAVFTQKVSQRNVFLHNPERIAAVVSDMVTHFHDRIAPNGMKAQVIVGDQELCVKYADALTAELKARALPYRAAVVISGTGKQAELAAHAMSAAEEDALLDRFRNYTDPLSFLVVTAKLGTGFNAPIEGVLYLDKPMKLHTLFQAITRTNRPWSHPDGTFSKRYGTIVDYIGLGDGFARAMAPSDPEHKQQEIDFDGLLDSLELVMKMMLARFVGVVREDTMDSLQSALARVPLDTDYRSDFQAEFMQAQGLWETIAPHSGLSELTEDYRWLAQVYSSIPTETDRTEALWAQLGAKTRELIHSHMTGVSIVDHGIQVKIADADTIAMLIKEGRLPAPPADLEGKSATEIVDSLMARIRQRLEGSPTPGVYKSIADRLEKLAQQEILRAEDSLLFLTTVFEIGSDLKDIEAADDAGLLEDLPDPRIGRLQRIFDEHRPAGETVLVEQVVREVDALVKTFSNYEGWATQESTQKELIRQLRILFRKNKLPLKGEPFDSALAYILKAY